MELEFSSDTQLHLIFKGADLAFVNAIRRIIMADLLIPAIDRIYIFENTSILHDEILAHRLSMIPLKGGEDLVPPDKCNCGGKGCSQCEVILSLEVEANENFTTVYSGKLKSEGYVYPVSDNIPIVKLNAGQKISLEAHARLGKGRDHAKWQPVSVCVIKYQPVILINEKCDLCGICVERCPEKILEVKDNKLIITSIWKCSLCKICEEVCPNSAINVSYNDNILRLTIESIGSRSNEELLLMACEYLINKCKELKESINSTIEVMNYGKENITN